MRLLVIEDEAHLLQQLKTQLEAKDFSVDVAEDGEAGFFLGREYNYDLAIIDIGLPKLSGIEVIQRLRQATIKYPILILTARDRWQDKVVGLEAGADDYLTKPFHSEELMARVNALLRRATGHSSPKITLHGICLDTASQSVSINELPVSLTSYEYRVLEYLMLHAGEVISKTVLTEHIYDQDFDRDSNVLEVFIGRLRKKLTINSKTSPIETRRGQGYCFRADDGVT